MPMNKPVFRIVGLDHATCDDAYCGAETTTRPIAEQMFDADLSLFPPTMPATVTVRLRDMLPAFQSSATARLAWINDFADDPVVISKDLYDVLLTYQRFKNAA